MKSLPVTPKSVIKHEVIIPTPPTTYSGYLYKFTDIKTGRMYVGVHKGPVSDSYWHSSTNKEFAKICSGDEPRLKYEILAYGEYDVMTVKEHHILKKAKAHKNPKYFNETNGSPKFQSIDYDKVNDLAFKINNGEFYDGMKPIEDVTVLDNFQVRAVLEDRELIRYIAQSIDDNLGNTKLHCAPVTIFEGRSETGDDTVGNGRHTMSGVKLSKHGKTVPTNYVPFEDNMTLTEAELKAVCNLLNKGRIVKTNPVNREDAVKYLVDCWFDGIPTTDPGHIGYLNNLGFTNQMLTRIIDEADNEIDDLQRDKNEVFRGYSQDELQNMTKNLNTEDTLAWYSSSSIFKWQTVLDKVWAAVQPDKDGNLQLSGYTKIKTIIHHTEPSAKKKWNARPKDNPKYGPTRGDVITRYLDFFMGKLGLESEVIVLNSTIKSGAGDYTK